MEKLNINIFWFFVSSNLSSQYWSHIDLPTGTASDKVLSDKTFKVTKYSKYYGYQRGLASMVYKVFAERKKKKKEQ